MRDIYKLLKEKSFITNHLAASAPFDGRMFETFGEELQYVIQNQERVYTLIDDGEGEDIIVQGYRWCNRIGYFIEADK